MGPNWQYNEQEKMWLFSFLKKIAKLKIWKLRSNIFEPNSSQLSCGGLLYWISTNCIDPQAYLNWDSVCTQSTQTLQSPVSHVLYWMCQKKSYNVSISPDSDLATWNKYIYCNIWTILIIRCILSSLGILFPKLFWPTAHC